MGSLCTQVTRVYCFWKLLNFLNVSLIVLWGPQMTFNSITEFQTSESLPTSCVFFSSSCKSGVVPIDGSPVKKTVGQTKLKGQDNENNYHHHSWQTSGQAFFLKNRERKWHEAWMLVQPDKLCADIANCKTSMLDFIFYKKQLPVKLSFLQTLTQTFLLLFNFHFTES